MTNRSEQGHSQRPVALVSAYRNRCEHKTDEYSTDIALFSNSFELLVQLGAATERVGCDALEARAPENSVQFTSRQLSKPAAITMSIAG